MSGGEWLLDPGLWTAIAAKLTKQHPGPRFCQYDLSDSSEATDVAQIVCEILHGMRPS